jgi:hypothetical protein
MRNADSYIGLMAEERATRPASTIEESMLAVVRVMM